MCGISGIKYMEKDRKPDPQLLTNMVNVLYHRGPDQQGIKIIDNVGLGHSRLSIVDLSINGKQPMSNEDGKVWICFNGEIYNHLSLRKFLVDKGHIFKSKTDTEVIIHLWEELGNDCVKKLRGMFAFAIWDSKKQYLFLARDRMGQKPLYYSHLPDRFLFASEIKAILQDPDFIVEPDIRGINYYLSYQIAPSPFSAFKNIKKLPPGHCLHFKGGKCTIERYWKPSFNVKQSIKTKTTYNDLQEEIIEKFRESIKIRLMGDVQLGAFLSGGVDSSMIVAIMSEMMDQPVKTFTIGFDEENYNETKFAKIVAERFNTDHHEQIITEEAKEIIPHLVWHYNEPFSDPSAIPTYYLSKLAKEHVTVILSGEGGDEHFGGYDRYKNIFTNSLSDWKQLNVNNSFELLLSKIGIYKRSVPTQLRKLNAKSLRYYLNISLFNESIHNKLYSKEMLKCTENYPPSELFNKYYKECDSKDHFDKVLFYDIFLYLSDVLMTKTDVASMAHSLEVRCPMLDHL